jgi:hypothetical protein
MNNEAVAHGILNNDRLVVTHPLYRNVALAARSAAKIYAHHIDGEGTDRVYQEATVQGGFIQQAMVKAVEREIGIDADNQAAGRQSSVGDMTLRMASDAAFQFDNIRIHNAITLPEQKFNLGADAERLVIECRTNPWKAKEVRHQSRGDYTSLPMDAQIEVADDIGSMRHMSAATQIYAMSIVAQTERDFAALPAIAPRQEQPVAPAFDQAVGM